MTTEAERVFQIGNLKFELVNVFEPDEVFIEGTVMLERAEKADAILNDIVALRLRRNKHRVPKKLKEIDIALAGITENIGCIKAIPYLHFDGKSGNWREGLGGVNFDWSENVRLLRACG